MQNQTQTDERPPRIGEPRLYDGVVVVLYPGEVVTAIVSTEELAQAAAVGEIVQPSMWLVEPMPGWSGLYRRWRWRLIGQWLERLERLKRRIGW